MSAQLLPSLTFRSSKAKAMVDGLFARAFASLLFFFALFPSTASAVSSSPHFGLTIITHGWQLDDTLPPWLVPMGLAVADQNGGQEMTPVYKLRILQKNWANSAFGQITSPILIHSL